MAFKSFQRYGDTQKARDYQNVVPDFEMINSFSVLCSKF